MMWLMVTNLSNTAHTHVMSPSFRRSLPHVHFKCVAFLFLKFCPRLWFLCANHERLIRTVHVALSLTLCCRFFVFFVALNQCAHGFVCVHEWVTEKRVAADPWTPMRASACVYFGGSTAWMCARRRVNIALLTASHGNVGVGGWRSCHLFRILEIRADTPLSQDKTQYEDHKIASSVRGLSFSPTAAGDHDFLPTMKMFYFYIFFF